MNYDELPLKLGRGFFRIIYGTRRFVTETNRRHKLGAGAGGESSLSACAPRAPRGRSPRGPISAWCAFELWRLLCVVGEIGCLMCWFGSIRVILLLLLFYGW